MLKITIIAVGKAKEKYLSDGYSEYIKRLSGYCNLNIVELAPTKADEGSPASIAAAIENEGEKILAKIPAQIQFFQSDFSINARFTSNAANALLAMVL